MKKRCLRRGLAILLAMILAIGNVGVFAETFLADVAVYVPEVQIAENATHVETEKYIRLYKISSQDTLAQATHNPDGSGYTTKESKPYIPVQDDVYIEFNMERTQEIELKVLNEDGLEIGYITRRQFEGQWGDLDGNDYPVEHRVANRVMWDGTYNHYINGPFVVPKLPLDPNEEVPELDRSTVIRKLGCNEAGQIIMERSVYKITFSPTDPRTSIYNVAMDVIVDYSDIAFLQNLQFINGGLVWKCPGQNGGDPVDMISGNFTWQHVDLELRGARPLMFYRNYNAQDKHEGPLGVGWRHNYQVELDRHEQYTVITMENGYQITFNNYSNDTYGAPEKADVRLENEGSGYVMTTREKTHYHFNENGQLVAVEDATGQETTITYSGADISTIQNCSGIMTFENTDGKITAITDTAGRTIRYDYMGSDLVSFTDADGYQNTYAYDGNHNLELVTDFEGELYLQNIYDDKGRVTTQTLQGEGTSYFEYDFDNMKSIFTDAEGSQFIYYYDEKQSLTAMEDLDGRVTYTYENGRVFQETDRLGNTWGFQYDEDGNPIYKTYPDGTTESFTYNVFGKVTEHIRQDGSILQYTYDEMGNLIQFTDAKGRGTQLIYYPDSINLMAVIDPLGNTTSYTYDEAGNVLSMTDPKGAVTAYQYDGASRLLKTIYPDGSTAENSYTPAGKRVTVTDAFGNVTTTIVSPNGYDEALVDPMGYTAVTEYNTQNKPMIVTDKEGNSTTYDYDQRGNIQQVTNALGQSVSYVYDAKGRLKSVTDAKGHTWSYAYDKEGRLEAAIDPLQNASRTSYNNMGQIETQTNQKGYVSSYTYDDLGRILSTTDFSGNTSHKTYDLNGNIETETDNRGNTWVYTYDDANRLKTAQDPLGNTTTYAYDANGNAEKTVTALGFETRQVYDVMGRIQYSYDKEGHQTEYQYDLAGRLEHVIYPDLTMTTNRYNLNGWLESTSDAKGATTAYTYNKNGQVLTITDPLGYITTYTYTALGQIETILDAEGGLTSYTYDLNGNQETVTDALGNTTTYTYDALNRVQSITDPMGGITTTQYDEAGNIKEVITAEGGHITFDYDGMNRVKVVTDAENNSVSRDYDENGNLIRETDGRGYTTTRRYDVNNRLEAIINPLLDESKIIYDADGRIDYTLDFEGNRTDYTYDNDGRILALTDALGHTTTFTYDDMGRVKTSTDAKAGITSFTYTPTGKIETITDALGGLTSYTYDDSDRVLTETNPENETKTYTYDGLGRVLTERNPLGHIQSFTYDKMSRIETVTDHNGNITTYRYDGNGNLKETIDALGHSTTYIYDVMNQLTEIHQTRTDSQDGVLGEEQVTYYTYDKRGLVLTEVKGAFTTTYEYDENGNRIKLIDGDNNLTVYTYDPRNLVETINYQDNKTVSFSYNKNGVLKTTTDWTGTLTFELDLLGRIQSVNDQNGKVTSYTYDAVGNKETMLYPDGKLVQYTYDALNRMKTVTDGENQITSYSYDKAGRVLGMIYPNGWKETNTYDDAGQLLTVHDQSPGSTTKGLKFQYAYDPNGNILREYRRGTGLGQKKEDYTHVYDVLNRLILTNGLYGKTQTTYTYDTLSNLTYEQSGTSKMVDYDYNSLNQLIGKTVNGKDIYTYTYDGRGNQIQNYNTTKNRIEETYTYDATGRMTLGTNAIGEESAYLYTGLGDLLQNTWTVKKNAYGYHDVQLTTAVTDEDATIIRDTPTSTTGKKKDVATPEQVALDPNLNQTSTIQKTYVIDHTSMYKDAIMETETGGLTYRYTFGLEKISAVLSPVDVSAGNIVQNGTVKLYFHRDRLGNTDYLSDNVQGKAVSYVDYDDWGNPIKKAVLKMGLREVDLVKDYTGHTYDPVLNKYYAKARLYDAESRRFMAVDPVKGTVTSPISLNPYVYVLNNPLGYTDPSGMVTDQGGGFGPSLTVTDRFRYSDPHAPVTPIVRNQPAKPTAPIVTNQTTQTTTDFKNDGAFYVNSCEPVEVSRQSYLTMSYWGGWDQNSKAPVVIWIPKEGLDNCVSQENCITFALGYGGAIGGGVGVMGSGSVATDFKGSYLGMITVGGGGTTPAMGHSGQITITNAKSLDDLKGWGVEAGISISPVPSIGGGVEYVGGSSYDGVSISFGANNVIAPFEVHGYATYTWGKLVSKDDIDNFNDEIEMRLEWLNNSLPNEVKNQINEHLGAPVFTTK